MAPTVTQKFAALSSAHVKNNSYGTDSLENERKPTAARWVLRRACSAFSGGTLPVGTPHQNSDASTGTPPEEKRNSWALAEPLTESWADMEDDDEPFLDRLGSSDSGTAVASRGRPISTELSRGLLLLDDLCKPPDKPPAKVTAAVEPSRALPTGGQTCGLVPRTAATVRTPLSAKSRPFAPQPFVPGFYPAVSPACQWEGAVPFCIPTKPVDDKGKADVKTEEDEWTTVMLCGFPRNYSRDKLIDLLEVNGYAGQFDFVYIPMDFEFSECVGYAFVNLTTAAAALCLKGFFEGSVGHPFTDDKPCRTNWSRVQGLGANVKQYRNSPIMHKLVPDEFKPVLFWNGQPQPFPEPTAALKQLRPHRKKEKTQGEPKALHD